MFSEPSVNVQLAGEMGLLPDEYRKVLQILDRIPTYTELGIFAVMWSEHCSYKNSIAVLKTLPRSGGRLLVEAGEENAGLVDIGDNLAIAFKIESHNHPSAIEPYQGAATGVGGILRDIFTMGARPIAALNSLRFGPLTDPRSRYLFKNSVKGIGDYGNSFGVPTVAGEVCFDPCYSLNCLINAMAVGVVHVSQTASATAGKPGDIVLIVGSSTGRDGIHGATFASEEINDASDSKRPSVQVGDPFTEKILMEATLEVISEGLVAGIQDMGAAGLTCSSTEMSAKAGVGMRLDLDRIPLREANMSAYEIMLSESQERMLIVAERMNVDRISQIFSKWDLPCTAIGIVTAGKHVEIYRNGKKEADVPAAPLTLGNGAPVYFRESKIPEYYYAMTDPDVVNLLSGKDMHAIARSILSSHNIASKRWAFEQYDSMVQNNTLLSPRFNAAVVRINGTRKAIALKTDGNARYVYLDPFIGGQIAVAEAARNVACTGATPVAITNCLNFGNPYDPEVYWQFKEAVRGIGEACKILDTPVTGGNVSFYNESQHNAIFPTPVIGMLGLIEDISDVITPNFKKPGDLILMLGSIQDEFGGSELVHQLTGKILGHPPNIDLHKEKSLYKLIQQLNKLRLINSCHDVSDGGIFVTLAESCFGSDSLGASISDENLNFARLFSESQSVAIVSSDPENLENILSVGRNAEFSISMVGHVTSDSILAFNKLGLKFDREELEKLYFSAIPNAMS